MNEIIPPTLDAEGRTSTAVTMSPQHAPAIPVDRVLTAIIAAAENPAVDVAKMKELLGLQKELMAMQAEQQFNEAFHRLTLEMPRIKKNGSVEYKGKEAFRFATWEAIDAAIRPLLQREGFSLSFDTSPRQGEGGGIVVTGTLSHVAGHKRTASIPLALDMSGGKNNIQGMGSTFSYGKRYCATALLNIITEGEDDDGNRGGMKFLSAEQVENIQELMTEIKQDEGRFLQYFGAAHIQSMDAANYVPAVNMLVAKLPADQRDGWRKRLA